MGGELSSSVVSFEEATALAEEHGTPLLVCDIDRVRDNYKKLKELFHGFDLCYAVKANPHPEIVKALVELDSHFDVASKNEIELCLELGAKPEHLLYANPVKPWEYIEFAYRNNVRTFTFDTEQELEKMARHAPGSEVILRLSVRDIGSVCKFSMKFGAKEEKALNLLQKAKDLGLQPVGLSFHVGSQCTRMENFGYALNMCSRVFKLAEKNSISLSVLDIGGGIPVNYVNDVYSWEDLASLINQKIPELFPKGVRLIAEPGRPMVADAMTLITRVIGVGRHNGGNECIYLDDGCYNSLSEKIFGHCEYKLLSNKREPMRSYTVFGPTCDSMDVITKDALLPELKENDLILIPNAGAYTNAAATHFNGFDPAKILFLHQIQKTNPESPEMRPISAGAF